MNEFGLHSLSRAGVLQQRPMPKFLTGSSKNMGGGARSESAKDGYVKDNVESSLTKFGAVS